MQKNVAEERINNPGNFYYVIEEFMSKIKIIQTRSVIDRPKDQKRTIEALGLGRPNYEKIHNDTPQIRGMINKVSHLVRFEEIKD